MRPGLDWGHRIIHWYSSYIVNLARYFSHQSLVHKLERSWRDRLLSVITCTPDTNSEKGVSEPGGGEPKQRGKPCSTIWEEIRVSVEESRRT